MLSRIYNITRRGLACVAYPYIEAMREPDYRDRRGGTNSHVFFISYLKHYKRRIREFRRY